MAALDKNLQIQHVGNPDMIWSTAVAADEFYAGALVYGDETTGLCQVTAAAGDRILGICSQHVSAAIGDKIPIYVSGVFLLAWNTPAATDVGTFLAMDAAVLTDNPGDAQGSLTLAANDCAIGIILAIEGSAGWVRLWTGPLYDAAVGWK